MIIRRRNLAFPASESSVPHGRLQDLLLSALFIASGPVLWRCGAAILRDQPELLSRFGQIRDLPGIATAEALLGLLAAGSGLLVSAGAGVAVLAAMTQQIARRCGAWRLERLLVPFSPGFLRRSAALALGAGLALTASAADSWPRTTSPQTASVSETAAFTAADPATRAVGDSAGDAADGDSEDGEPDSALFDISGPPDPGPTDPAEPDPVDREPADPDAVPDAVPDAAEDHGASSSPESPGSARSTPGAPNSDRLHGRAQRQVPEPEQVVVRLGDCLWDIVADHLGPDATDWEIAATWPEWYQVNRDRIGPDPGIILPGTILDAPPG